MIDKGIDIVITVIILYIFYKIATRYRYQGEILNVWASGDLSKQHQHPIIYDLNKTESPSYIPSNAMALGTALTTLERNRGTTPPESGYVVVKMYTIGDGGDGGLRSPSHPTAYLLKTRDVSRWRWQASPPIPKPIHTLILVFMGLNTTTAIQSMRDNKYNLKRINYINFSDIYANTVPYKIYTQFRQELYDDIVSLKGISTDIFICGYSMGSAVATICCADLLANLPHYYRIWVYVFASPRTGESELKKFIEDQPKLVAYNNIINLSDSITNLPPSVMYHFKNKTYYGYVHVGNPISFIANYKSDSMNHAMSVYLDNIYT